MSDFHFDTISSSAEGRLLNERLLRVLFHPRPDCKELLAHLFPKVSAKGDLSADDNRAINNYLGLLCKYKHVGKKKRHDLPPLSVLQTLASATGVPTRADFDNQRHLSIGKRYSELHPLTAIAGATFDETTIYWTGKEWEGSDRRSRKLAPCLHPWTKGDPDDGAALDEVFDFRDKLLACLRQWAEAKAGSTGWHRCVTGLYLGAALCANKKLLYGNYEDTTFFLDGGLLLAVRHGDRASGDDSDTVMRVVWHREDDALIYDWVRVWRLGEKCLPNGEKKVFKVEIYSPCGYLLR